jgi:hypothetical protein
MDPPNESFKGSSARFIEVLCAVGEGGEGINCVQFEKGKKNEMFYNFDNTTMDSRSFT